jgi:diguanylate cyclase (GGDEF)-like protein/PAS domain S-box-containing protein
MRAIRDILRATPAQAALFGVVYFALARGGLALAGQPDSVSVISAGSGLYLGILLVTPRRRWPAFVIAAFAADLLASLGGGDGLAGVGIALADASDAPLAAILIGLVGGTPFALTRIRHVLALALAGAGVANALTSLVGAAAVAASSDQDFAQTWLVWWTANGIGMLAVAPVVCAAFATTMTPPTRAELIEFLLLLGGLVLSAVIVFSLEPGTTGTSAAVPPALAVPFLLLMAWRSGPAATAVGVFALCTVASVFTVRGLGPLAVAGLDPSEQLLSLQLFLAVWAVTAMTISAALSDGREAQAALRSAERRFRTLVEQIPTVTYICDYDEDATLRYISPQAETMTGYPTSYWLADQDHWRQIVHPDDREEIVEAVARCVREQVPFAAEYRMVHANGKVIQILDRETIVRDEDGRPLTSQGVLLDVTELRQTERALIESEELHRSVVDALEEGVFVLNADGIIVAANASGARVLGVTVESLIGSPPPFNQAFLVDGTPLDLHNSPAMRVLRTGVAERDVELRVVRPSGEERWLRVNYQPLGGKGSGGGLVFSFTDVTERRRDEAQIAHLAYHDTLTGLPNRTALERALSPALARASRAGRAAALIYLDLDHFKVVNDSLGHAAGDEVLRQVADRLKARVRDGDTLVRLGGDEFMLLMPDLGGDASEAAWRVAGDLIAQLEGPFAIGHSEFEVTASAGIALYPLHGSHGEELLKHADAALYGTKRDERGTVGIYENQEAESTGRLTLSSRVRRALAEDEFELHFQPVFSLDDLEPIGVEALIRWRDPERGLVQPGEFIPLAEETGLIDLIGNWVIDAVIAQGESWLDLGLSPLLAFNVSARQLRRRGFAAEFARKLGASTMNPIQLSLEITESASMAEAHRSSEILERLHELGVHLAIDDFGADFSSLSRLRDLPVDMLKIDRSFLHGVPQAHDASAVVTAILRLAEALEMRAVAEGVETEAQLEFLRAQGCQLGQGFHLGRPMPAEQVTRLLLGEPAAAEGAISRAGV